MESNWQDDLSLLESMDYMLTNEVDCDISFKLGKAGSDVVPAHKFVLASRSSVFRAMLYGPLAEKSCTVDIPDVESGIFKCFLRYVYTDNCAITSDNVTALMYTAHKYNVRRLVKECGQFMMDNMSTANVCTIMENANLFDNRELRQKCLEFIQNQCTEIVESKLLTSLGPDCLGEVLRSEELDAKEEDIFAAVVSWADCRCTEKCLEVNGSNRRQVLGDLLYLVRFPLTSQKTFASISEANENLLSLEEQVVVFRGYATGNFSNSPFSSKMRSAQVQTKEYTCFRFQGNDIKDSGTMWSNNSKDAIMFKVSEPVYIVGLILFGCKEGSTTYNVHVEITELGQKVHTTVASTSTEKTFQVNFTEPVAVNRDTNYTLTVFLNRGPCTYYGENGISNVDSGSIKFTFSSSYLSTNSTGVSRDRYMESHFQNVDTLQV
ncbi:BTB/POZ domain-containing protein 6-like [Pecten maximus]|uniref:BTB/POZ domain-containing protein 6-like n=1 Tax=Pecten maximus TaxID=6579 RepID=UPI0014589C7E|nr:BTB/POZ domain-containing protein 6-like [Pecten maximus]